MRPWLRAVSAAIACWTAAPVPAQDFVWSLTDGTRVTGRLTAIREGLDPAFVVATATEQRTLRFPEVVAAQGKSCFPATGPLVVLAGGDRLRGDLRGGDSAGESFVVRSPSLGERTVKVDRLSGILLPSAGTTLGERDLRIPEGAKGDEAIFLPTRRGYDMILGSIERFTRTGILFRADEAVTPREHPFTGLLGVAVRGGAASQDRLQARLLTRAGDRIAVTPSAVEGERCMMIGEGKQRFTIPLAEIAALTVVGDDRTFLSDLVPAEVSERSFYAGAGAPPLYPFRRDETSGGEALAANGLGYGKGLGVHSYSRLVFEVPAGRTRLLGLVGYDDEGRQLAWVKPRVDARVSIDGKVALTFEGLAAGEAAQSLGSIRVAPGNKVALEVDFGPDGDHADRIDWLNVVFVK